MSWNDEPVVAPIDEPDIPVTDDTWAVVLREYEELPHAELSEKLSDGVRPTDEFMNPNYFHILLNHPI